MNNSLRTGLILLMLIFVSACSGLAGEPAVVATLPPAPQNTDVGYPVALPDLAQGAEIFAARCVRCHGPGGEGNGELVINGELPSPPTDMTAPVTARTQTPYDWFEAINNGSLEKLMPPWRDTLSEPDRWDVAFYTYTLSYSPAEIEQGQTIWQAECASCHGESGQGDGPDAPGPMPDLTDQTFLVQTSDTDMVLTVTSGVGEMPSFEETLDEGQRWAVVTYLRTLALDNVDTIGETIEVVAAPATTEEAPATVPTAIAEDPATAPDEAAAVTQGTITGQVINASAEELQTEGLNAILHIVDEAFNEETIEQPIAADGTFRFDEVAINPALRYFVTVLYGDGFFISDIVTGAEATLELPVTVYERTDDPGVIRIAAVLGQVTETEEGLQVVQIFNFANTSNRMYLSGEDIDEFRQSSVRIQLPPEAVVLDMADESGRYVVEGHTLIDTRPVFPGEDHIVHVLYALPFDSQASVSLPLNYAFEGPVRLLAAQNLNISGQQFPQGEPQAMGEVVYNTFGSQLSLPADSALQFDVTRAGSTSQLDTGLLSSILFAVGGVAILLAVVLFVYGRRQSSQTVPEAAPDTPAPAGATDDLVAQIAVLDERFEAGEITRKDYDKQRQILKDRLSRRMKKGDS